MPEGRGALTPIVAAEMQKFLGREGTTEELRLIPYVGYVAQNEQVLDLTKINPGERSILQRWREAGYMEGGASGLSISYPFWCFLQRIIWLSYIGYKDQETALAEIEQGA